MKLATFCHEDAEPRIGVAIDAGIVDLLNVDPRLPRTMIELIQGGESLLSVVRQAVAGAPIISLSEVRLLAPVPQPPEFIGVGLNYLDHLDEALLPLPAEPTVFNKQTSCITGPFDDVVLPRVSTQLDYEGELGFVIGRARRNLSREEAAAAIFGYVVVNDLSIRDWQFMSGTVTLGKSFDTHGPFGPWITTADEVPAPQNLTVVTTVNQEVRQRGVTSDMIFDCVEIVAFLSRVMTLMPGTIVTTGTPSGVGHFRHPTAYLRVGDTVSVDISGIGRLVNHVVAEP